MATLMQELIERFEASGRVEWIGVRPARDQPVVAVDSAVARPGGGLDGDRYSGIPGGKREVTLIQLEHLEVVGALLRSPPIRPDQTRRNVVVSGINLQSLRDREFEIGEARFRGTGFCHPCSKMESTIGVGGYAAMLGHGGLTATVVSEGRIAVGDSVRLVRSESPIA